MADIITSDPNPQDTNLTAYIQVILHANFSRKDTSYTDDPFVQLNYQKIKHLLSQGSFENQADLFYQSLSTYIDPFIGSAPGEQTYNFDNNTLKDIYGKPLNFSTVRVLIIKNNATNLSDRPTSFNPQDGIITYSFKQDSGTIAPGGYRVLGDPSRRGITNRALFDTTPSIEGSLVITNYSSTAGEYDLLVIGSSAEGSSSSSSGV